MWIIIAMVALAGTFWYMGWRWETTTKRPKLGKTPLVSILIPAYNSEKTIADTIKSAKNLDYPHKEIIVVNDSDDKTPSICRKLGVRCIQSKIRRGKAYSLNQAVKKTKGEILFFIDSDSTVSNDSLKKIIPWFSDPNTGAVAPRFRIKNRTNFLTKMISLEHQIQSALFKVHMFLGSMISFRGCGVAIRRSVFERLGGWPQTLIEDTDFAGDMLTNGLNIHYEPDALVETIEPDTYSELKRQRIRWGKGTLYSFTHHKKTYKRNSQFMVYFIPYILLILGIIGFFLWQTALFFIPIISLYMFYAIGIKEVILLLIIFMAPLYTNAAAAVTTAALGHIAIVTYGEEKDRRGDWIYIIPYIFIYFPMMIGFYLKGIIAGMKDNKKGKPEIDFNDW
ncbi:MAG: glycosyltransferase family 2 protein [Candidatus Aenigmatarchaeota archaeon]